MTTSGKTILIVDDQKFLRMTVGLLLTKKGYVISEAEDGEDALAFMRSVMPDLVLLDVNMPGMPGVEVCRRIKANPRTRSVRVIMLTSDGEKETVVECLEAGADDYQLKPYTPDKLYDKIENVLNGRTAEAGA